LPSQAFKPRQSRAAECPGGPRWDHAPAGRGTPQLVVSARRGLQYRLRDFKRDRGARAEIHVGHIHQAVRLLWSDLYVPTSNIDASVPLRAIRDGFCVPGRAALTWPRPSTRRSGRTCMSVRAPNARRDQGAPRTRRERTWRCV